MCVLWYDCCRFSKMATRRTDCHSHSHRHHSLASSSTNHQHHPFYFPSNKQTNTLHRHTIIEHHSVIVNMDTWKGVCRSYCIMVPYLTKFFFFFFLTSVNLNRIYTVSLLLKKTGYGKGWDTNPPTHPSLSSSVNTSKHCQLRCRVPKLHIWTLKSFSWNLSFQNSHPAFSRTPAVAWRRG